MVALVALAGPLRSDAGAGSDPFSTEALVAKTRSNGLKRSASIPPCLFDPRSTAPLTLSDVVERALCSNPQTKAAWEAARVQAALYGVAEGAYLPTLDASAAFSRNAANSTLGGTTTYSQTSLGLSASYLLFDFGGRDASALNAYELLAAANASQNATLQGVFLTATEAYYESFAAEAAVDSAKQAEKSSLESLNAAIARYQAGVATPADRLQAQTAYSQATLTRIRAEGDARVAQGALANSMGLDANAPLRIARPKLFSVDQAFERNIDELIETGKRLRPDLAAAQAQIRAAEANVDIARASGKPSISVSATLDYSKASISETLRSGAIGLSLNIPIFTGYTIGYRIRAAQAQVETKVAQRDQLSQQVALEVWRAYQSLKTETEAVRSSADLVASATQSERVALGRYKAGVGTILDLLNAQAALASARLQQNQAIYNWHITRVALAQAIGQLDFSAIAETSVPPAK
jgi:outer membrane protein